MIKRIVNIKNVFWALFALLLIFRFNLIISGVNLIFRFAILALTDFNSAAALSNLNLIDLFLSVILLFVFPLIIIYLAKRRKFLNTASLPASALIVLLFGFLFAPLIVDGNPDFQKDLSVTRLLPPLSSVEQIRFFNKEQLNASSKDKLIHLKNQVVKNTFDENLFYCRGIKKNKDGYSLLRKGVWQNISIEKYDSGVEPEISRKYFILGTDELGRDVFARLVYGSRVSIFIGLLSVFISFIIGILFGFIAGYAGAYIDIIISRFTEMFLAFPLIFFIILVLALFGNSIFTVIFVLGFSGWMSLLKIVKGEVVALKNKDYFITARQLGLSKKQLLAKEVLPVISVPVIVNMVFQFGNVILAESALSYLGFGVGNQYPSWGGMIHSGQLVINNGWWLILFPGLLIVATLLTANRFGKELNCYFYSGIIDDK